MIGAGAAPWRYGLLRRRRVQRYHSVPFAHKHAQSSRYVDVGCAGCHTDDPRAPINRQQPPTAERAEITNNCLANGLDS